VQSVLSKVIQVSWKIALLFPTVIQLMKALFDFVLDDLD